MLSSGTLVIASACCNPHSAYYFPTMGRSECSSVSFLVSTCQYLLTERGERKRGRERAANIVTVICALQAAAAVGFMLIWLRSEVRLLRRYTTDVHA